MTQILVDKELRDKLMQSQFAELVDDTGTVLGSFVSFRSKPADPSLEPPISEEERRRLYAEPGVYTTEQVLERLRSL
ncbi:MAG TPA: hypothetical protein VK137_18710 [Planctomycetaceae bacterium]|nr:hypothetical protein [Planctomycetaceae bacterium]